MKTKIISNRYQVIQNDGDYFVIDSLKKGDIEHQNVGDSGGYRKKPYAQVLADYLNAAQTAPKKTLVKMGKVKGKKSGYQYEEHEMVLADHDTDIKIILPHGEEYVFQWRVENQTVDLCIGKGSDSLLKNVYLECNDGSGKRSNSLADQITIC